jgi:hypothetical protein
MQRDVTGEVRLSRLLELNLVTPVPVTESH